MNTCHWLVCLLVSDLIRQVVLEPVLHLFFSLEVISLLDELMDPLQDLLRHLVGLTQLERISVCFLVEFVPDRQLNAIEASIDEDLELVVVEIERFCVPSIVDLILEAVVHLKMENLFDVEQDLDDPVFTDSPFTELGLQTQLTCGWVDERVEYWRGKEHSRHLLGVLLREIHPELEDRIGVDTLLA